MGNIHVKLFFKFGPVVQEMSFKEKNTDDRNGGTTRAGRRPITIPHLEPPAQVSKNITI